MSDLLALTAHLPEVTFEPGDAVVTAGHRTHSIYVLVSGSLRVLKGGIEVNTITAPGSAVGEMSVLLDADSMATVEAVEPSRLRVAEDGAAFLDSDPRITRSIAEGMAQRLNTVTAYLADLKQQYGDHPGIAMVSDVLQQLTHHHHHVEKAVPGSARDPDPEY